MEERGEAWRRDGGACGVTRWERVRVFRLPDGSVYEALFSGRVAVRRIPSARARWHGYLKPACEEQIKPIGYARASKVVGSQFRERTVAGFKAARARGRKFALSKAQVRLAQVAMTDRDTTVKELCRELGVGRVIVYRHVNARGGLREQGKRVLER